MAKVDEIFAFGVAKHSVLRRFFTFNGAFCLNIFKVYFGE